MARERVHISDWIQFLTGIIDRGYSNYIGYFSVGFALILSMITVIALSTAISSIDVSNDIKLQILDNITYLYYMLGIGGIVFVFMGIFLKLKSRKAEHMLNEIMQNPGEIEVNEILRKWNGRNVNMRMKLKNHIWKIAALVFFLIVGIVLIILGINNNNTAEKIGFMSLGVSAISFGIAVVSLSESIGSDNKMQSLTELNFIEKNAIIQLYMQSYSNNQASQRLHEAKRIMRDLEATFRVFQWLKMSDALRMKENFIIDFINFTELLISNGVMASFEDDDKENYRSLIIKAKEFNFNSNELDSLLQRL